VPTYQYTCTDCGGSLEAVQKFTDDPLTVCDDCGGRLRKVFSPVGIVFKGSGFYRTDSRNGSSPATLGAKDKDGKDGKAAGSSSAAESSAGSGTEATKKKPEPAPVAAKASSSSGEKVA
jgi:putative FmdB family regulatory protein